MSEIMISSTGRRVEYSFQDGTATRDDGQIYENSETFLVRGSKVYYKPIHTEFQNLKPKTGFLTGAYFQMIAVSGDHIEYYVSGSVKTILQYLEEAKELGHDISYPDKIVLASYRISDTPVISFRYNGDTLLEVGLYIATPETPAFASATPLPAPSIVSIGGA